MAFPTVTHARAAEPVDMRRLQLQRLLPALTPIIVLAIAIIGYLVTLRPKLFEIRTLQTRAVIAEELPALERRLANLERVRASFDKELGDFQEFIDTTLPPIADIPGLVATIDAIAQRAGVAIANVEVTRGVPPEALERVLDDNEVVAIGLGLRHVNYERLKAFLQVVAQSRRIIDTISVQFDPKRQTATLRLRAYTLTPE